MEVDLHVEGRIKVKFGVLTKTNKTQGSNAHACERIHLLFDLSCKFKSFVSHS